MGFLKDPMDRKVDSVLRKAKKASAATFKPALAGAWVARNVDFDMLFAIIGALWLPL